MSESRPIGLYLMRQLRPVPIGGMLSVQHRRSTFDLHQPSDCVRGGVVSNDSNEVEVPGVDVLFVALTHLDGVAVLTVGGEIDLLTAPQLEAALAELPLDRRALLDMRHVTFLGSTGISVILAHSQRLIRAGGSLQIRNPSEPIRTALRLTGLTGLLEHPTA